MKHKFVLLLLVSLFLMSSFESLTYAWTLVDKSGDWIICDRNHWKKEGWNEGYAEWNTTISDFNGYWFRVNTTTWENWREAWQIGVLGIATTSNDFWIKVKITTNTTSLWFFVQMHGSTSWIILSTLQLRYGVAINVNNWDQVERKYIFFDGYDWSVRVWNPDDYEVHIRNEEGVLKVYLLMDIPNQVRKYAIINTFNVTLTGNATITLSYFHGGQGKIEGYLYDSFTPPNVPAYELKGGEGGFFDWFFKLAQLDYSGIISVLITCVVIFIGFVKASLPLLGFFALFWILDCIISAIVHGEPRIVGDMIVKIYDFIRGIWQTLVNIACAIWDFITFWT